MDNDETDKELNDYFTAVINAIARKAIARNRNQRHRLSNAHKAGDIELAKEIHKMEEAARGAIIEMAKVSTQGLRPEIWLEESTDLKLHNYDGIKVTDTSEVGLTNIFKAKCNDVKTTYVDKNRKNGIRYANLNAQKVKDLITGANLDSEHSQLLHDSIDKELQNLNVETTKMGDWCGMEFTGFTSLANISFEIHALYKLETKQFTAKLSKFMQYLKDVSFGFYAPIVSLIL